jgi:hypothetical protein
LVLPFLVTKGRLPTRSRLQIAFPELVLSHGQIDPQHVEDKLDPLEKKEIGVYAVYTLGVT